MRDIDIRRRLRQDLDTEHGSDPNSLILDELGLCEGATRVDLAVINGEISGFEIKSERDTLARLPFQMEIYNKVLDRTVIIVGSNHLKRVLCMVPEWWGIQEAVEVDGGIELQTHRDPDLNPAIDPYALSQLLWRNEALEILEDHGLAKGVRSKPRRVLWSVLAANMPIDQLRLLVRDRLRTREGWRSDRQPESCDD